AVKQVRLQQLEDAKVAVEALNKTRAVTQARYDFYHTIEQINTWEQEQSDNLEEAQLFQALSQAMDLLGSVLALIPDAKVGAPTPAGTTYGGSNFAAMVQLIGREFSMMATASSHVANMAAIQGAWDRRWQEWKLQERLAANELKQIDQQIAGA